MDEKQKGERMKKEMSFNPVWFVKLKTWIHKAIQKISKKENLCFNCDKWPSCVAFREFQEIKNKFGINFILTRCKNFQNCINSQIRRRINCREFFNVWVMINKYTEGLREKQCMCINDCRNLNIKNRDRNCPAANMLYDACVKFNAATIVFNCPIWDTPQKLG